MRMTKLLLFVLMAFVLGTGLWGCSKPPEAEKEAARKAMDAAISAGAEQYASADLEAARKIWDTAESQMKAKNYKEARQSYLDAKAAFEKAGAAVEAGKKVVADEASAALKTLEKEWETLRKTATRVEKKLKAQKQAWRGDAKAISEGLATSKEMIASAPFEAKAKLDELKTMIDKWKATFKEMAKSPSKPKTKPKASRKKKS
jgi:hypothetical protein